MIHINSINNAIETQKHYSCAKCTKNIMPSSFICKIANFCSDNNFTPVFTDITASVHYKLASNTKTLVDMEIQHSKLDSKPTYFKWIILLLIKHFIDNKIGNVASGTNYLYDKYGLQCNESDFMLVTPKLPYTKQDLIPDKYGLIGNSMERHYFSNLKSDGNIITYTNSDKNVVTVTVKEIVFDVENRILGTISTATGHVIYNNGLVVFNQNDHGHKHIHYASYANKTYRHNSLPYRHNNWTHRHNNFVDFSNINLLFSDYIDAANSSDLIKVMHDPFTICSREHCKYRTCFYNRPVTCLT